MSDDFKIAVAILAAVASAFVLARIIALALDLVTIAITTMLVFAQNVAV